MKTFHEKGVSSLVEIFHGEGNFVLVDLFQDQGISFRDFLPSENIS